MILDTNALAAFVDGDGGLRDVLQAQPRLAIPVIVLGEFRYGIALSKHRSSYEAWLESHLSHFDILLVTDETAVAYAALRVNLRRSGHPIPSNDAWIAALATAAPAARAEPRRALRRRPQPRPGKLVAAKRAGDELFASTLRPTTSGRAS